MTGESGSGKSPAQGSDEGVGIAGQKKVSGGRTRDFEERLALLVAEKVEIGERFTTVDEMLCVRAPFGMQSNRPGSDGVEGRAEWAQPRLANGELRNAEALRGCIAVVASGECSFAVKARAVQRAGAIAAVIVDGTDSR
eukprot:3334714-Rhodomonas_salina.1